MKKRLLSALLALCMVLSLCLGLAAPAMAAEALPDWYFLFAVFKNVDTDCADGYGVVTHATYAMTQKEINVIRNHAKETEGYLNQLGVMNAHVDVVEIDTPVTELADLDYESWISPTEAAPLLKGKVDLDRYDHIFCVINLDINTAYLGLTWFPFENGTGYSCINFMNQEYLLQEKYTTPNTVYTKTIYVHEFLHFMERLSPKWGTEFDLHGIGDKYYMPTADDYLGAYTDIILNRVKGDAETGTGVPPAAWRYPPHVLRTMSELTIPDGVTGIGDWAFGNYTALSTVSIPASVTSVGYAAFWNTGVKDVYYGGTQAQWNAIQFGEYNSALTGANIHYNSAPAAPFTDVPAGIWYADAVAWAAKEGYVSGTNAAGTTFTPLRSCTEAEILTFLWNSKGRPESDARLPSAAADGQWYSGALRWAMEEGMIDDTFRLNTPCTRAASVYFLWLAYGSQGAAGGVSFPDVDPDADYAEAVAWAVGEGIVEGSGGLYNPNGIFNRASIALLLYRTLVPEARK